MTALLPHGATLAECKRAHGLLNSRIDEHQSAAVALLLERAECYEADEDPARMDALLNAVIVVLNAEAALLRNDLGGRLLDAAHTITQQYEDDDSLLAVARTLQFASVLLDGIPE